MRFLFWTIKTTQYNNTLYLLLLLFEVQLHVA